MQQFKVSKADINRVSQYKWQLDKSTGYWYTYNKKTKSKMYLHRFIVNCPKGKVVDHINHDKNDNRRCNLRICTQKENLRNRQIKSNNQTGYTNIYSYGNHQYILQYNCKGKNHHAGIFDDIISALLAKARIWKTVLYINIDKLINQEIKNIMAGVA